MIIPGSIGSPSPAQVNLKIWFRPERFIAGQLTSLGILQEIYPEWLKGPRCHSDDKSGNVGYIYAGNDYYYRFNTRLPS